MSAIWPCRSPHKMSAFGGRADAEFYEYTPRYSDRPFVESRLKPSSPEPNFRRSRCRRGDHVRNEFVPQQDLRIIRAVKSYRAVPVGGYVGAIGGGLDEHHI